MVEYVYTDVHMNAILQLPYKKSKDLVVGQWVWGGISLDERTDLVIVPGALTAERYIDLILEDHVIPAAYALKFLKTHRGIGTTRRNASSNTGLWPSVFNLAAKADIFANATCGQRGREEFCRMTDNGKGRCGICDNASSDPGKRHSINFAIDGTNKWWQSPALYYGPQYEFVTVTIDLKQERRFPQQAEGTKRKKVNVLPGRSIYVSDIQPEATPGPSQVTKIPSEKRRRRISSDSESSCNFSIYSETEDYCDLDEEVADQGHLDEEITDEGLTTPNNNTTIDHINNGNFVLFLYENQVYPGQVIQIKLKENKKTFKIKSLEKSGLHQWKWPSSEDVLWYEPKDIIEQLEKGSTDIASFELTQQFTVIKPVKCLREVSIDNVHLNPPIQRFGNKLGATYMVRHCGSALYESMLLGNYQVYQIAYVIVKAANSPRPGTWILEKSIDGENFEPWQYFARSDRECIERFGIPATKGKPHYFTDSEVICTSFYSKLTPMENGEIHTSLVHGRPGANETSPELLEFTKAQYVRLRLMGLRGTQEPLPRWFTQDIWKDKRLFYSIRDISVGGQCVCNGHAENCRYNVASGHPECECGHNTCGPNCERCCPMFNQRQWGSGTSRDDRQCLPCNCHGHATSCHYDEDVDKNGLSMDVHGNYQGGGVCDNCSDYTAGINCEHCMPGYFRPEGVPPEAKQPCSRCECDPTGSAGTCVQYGAEAGRCDCLPGYSSERCDACAPDYRGFPNCEPCPCDPKGVRGMGDCEGDCVCKIRSLKDWLITDLKVTKVVKPNWNGQSVFSLGNYEFSGITSLYWFAPEEYLGNKLEAYNSNFLFKVQWVVMRGDTSGEPTLGPNIILVGGDGLKIAHGSEAYTSDSMAFEIKLNESGWYVLSNDVTDIPTLDNAKYQGRSVTRGEFLRVLMNLKYILLRCTFHMDQIEALLEDAVLNLGNDSEYYSSVEKCSCPSGYTGLSCETCSFGHVRIYANTSNSQEQGFCGKCDCNGHSETCNPNTGECFCQHNTIGEKCERCAPGYYGNPLRGTPADCKRCACPLPNPENNFSPSCQLDYFAERVEDEGNYVCTQCPKGYTGDHCDICDDGYYGNPLEIGNSCRPCDCRGGPCDRLTGQCLSCKGNTEGWKCERCKPEHYGDPILANCKACECDPIGSTTKQCDNVTGQCRCKERFTGRTCSRCEVGYGNVTALCTACSCDPIGSKSDICDTHSGMCECRSGVEGFHCDACQNFYYGFSQLGCEQCDPCNKTGHICDPENGKCICPPLTEGEHCQHCVKHAWGYEPGIGCKDCNCSESGSSNLQCDEIQGRCTCKIGYEGEKCNKCSFGYYGYPECQECNCNRFGTIEEHCQDGVCNCSDNGSCECKENVQGQKCDQCKPKTFGLTRENPTGCIPCFCFEKSSECEEAHLNWDKIRAQKTNNETEVIDVDYWMLPRKFNGDLTTSYGGYLAVDVKGGFFRVTLEGNGVRLKSTASNELHLVENNWNIASRNSKFPHSCHANLSRTCFMVILQNVTSILVEANDRIREILLDRAKPSIPSYPPSHSIEKCECPKEYSGLSCQDPNEGYFRYFSSDSKNNWIDVVIGKAKPCQCNGRSHQCDPNTGGCKIYVKGYKGQFCEKCDEGYFDKGRSSDSVICEPCACNLFGALKAGICDEFGVCQCKEGFKGEKCNECVKQREYIKNGICTPCDECTMLLFSEIDSLVLDVEDTFNLIKDGVNPPWKILTTTMDKHHKLSEKFYEKKNRSEGILKHSKIDQCEKNIDKIQRKMKKGNKIVRKNIINIENVYNSSYVLVGEIKRSNKELMKTIEDLKSFGTKEVSVKDALKRAKEILKHVETTSKRLNSEEDREVFGFCSNMTQKVINIFKPPPDIPKPQLKHLKDTFHDFVNITVSVENMCNIAEEMNFQNVKRTVKLKEKIEKLKSNSQDLEVNMGNIIDDINATNHLLPTLEVVYGNLKNLSNFTEYTQLEGMTKRQMEENPQIEELFLTAMDHVQKLEYTIDSYKNIFNFTKDVWKKIDASGAYETLVSGIQEAKENVEISREILKKLTKLTNPTDADNIIDKTNLAHAYSDRLKQRINNLKDISKSVTAIKNNLDQFKYSILKSGKTNNDLNQLLHKMELDVTSQADRVSKLEAAIENSTAISDEMRQIEKNVQDMLISSQTRFFKKHNLYQNLTTKEEIEKLKTKLIDTREQLESLDISSPNFDARKNLNINNNNKNLQAIQKKIEELRNKIYYAKQAADAINVAMNISNCRMSYQLPQMEVFQSLSITFKCEACQLFRLSNDDGEINVEADDYSIILSYNNKNILVPNNAEDKEKTINIQKLGSLIKMQVDDMEPRQAKTDSEYFIIHPSDKIEIGRTDNNVIEKKTYISKVMLNGKQFGLWKFSRTEGKCTGEIRDETDKQPDNVNTFFNGKGYAVYGRNNKLNPTKLTLRFDFCTFDENSLIYLASFDDANSLIPQQENCAYIILFLRNGYLNLIVKHSNGLNSTLTLDNKYNNGRRYQAEIITEYEVSSGVQYYILFAKNETTQAKKKNSNHINRKNVFKIKQVSHHIGGVRPTFYKVCLPINVTSFLGFLKLTSQLTNEVMSYGIMKTGKQLLEFNQAWIRPNGYVNIKLLDEIIESISFILWPIAPNGLIMTLGQYNVSLSNYKLKIDGEKISYDANLDKNDYNIIQISAKEGTLVVNRNEKNINFSDDIKIQNRIVGIGDMNEGFSGGISNIFINNKELFFTPESVIGFSNVDIGREPPPAKINIKEKAVKSLSTHISNSMQNTEGCATSANYETDPDAVKYGDKSDSYTHIKTNFWKHDYKITFQFRTFYPNGGIQKQQHYNLLELTEGHLGLHIKGRRKNSPIILKERLNDGQWHNVEIFKRKRKVTIILDGDQKKTFKVPKNVVRNEIYLGGIPMSSDYLNANDLKYKLHSFRGCMKLLIINDEHQLIKNKDVRHNNIRQCFPNVEEGAYFGGDAYAIYKLQNGAIVMAVDMGNGAVSNVTNNLDSDFALCNNLWHNVTAMYSSSELTLNVDGILKIWVQSDVNSLMDEIDAPLYVGGLPDNAPVGTLKSRENFKGCIRKLKIENRLMDWSDMRELNNVLLNSCPLGYKKQRHRNDLGSTNYTVIREILDKPKPDRL
ncbi:laminin subunit alpha-1-like [Anoplophora glabripennis]|uniref:laminin subunit alpha-1-like n=1 Tax=Anoplophora glabripennis TaxID=217634 RepID=UPI000873AD07|nr:laminin subunit alpha-1-like [Anoplophora glabripennis]